MRKHSDRMNFELWEIIRLTTNRKKHAVVFSFPDYSTYPIDFLIVGGLTFWNGKKFTHENHNVTRGSRRWYYPASRYQHLPQTVYWTVTPDCLLNSYSALSTEQLPWTAYWTVALDCLLNSYPRLPTEQLPHTAHWNPLLAPGLSDFLDLNVKKPSRSPNL